MPNRDRIRILFDATILAEGLRGNSNRSGIFRASYEIFRALDARADVEFGIYAAPSAVDGANAFLAQEFPGRGYRALNRERSCFLGPVRDWIESRKELPRNRSGVRRRVLLALGMVTKVMRVLWDKYLAGRGVAVLADRYDVFFSPQYLAPRAVRRRSKARRWTLLHDAIPMLYPQFWPLARLGFSWNFDLIRGLAADDRCFAVSENTRRDFLRLNPSLRAERIVVSPLAADRKFHPEEDAGRREAVRRKYGIPAGKRYALSLCTLEPRKNLAFALEAFGRLVKAAGFEDMVFVLAGAQWASFERKWNVTLARLGSVRDRVLRIGYVDDGDLAALYSDAEFFVYPSLYEGFGLPPLEAMQCGTPVISSNTSSLPEVVGDAALTVAPDDLDGMIAAMTRLANDAGLREDLRMRGLMRARSFSWDRTAEVIVRGMRDNLV